MFEEVGEELRGRTICTGEELKQHILVLQTIYLNVYGRFMPVAHRKSCHQGTRTSLSGISLGKQWMNCTSRSRREPSCVYGPPSGLDSKPWTSPLWLKRQVQFFASHHHAILLATHLYNATHQMNDISK